MVVPPEASIPCPFSTRLATNADIPAIRAVVFSVRSEFDVRLIQNRPERPDIIVLSILFRCS